MKEPNVYVVFDSTSLWNAFVANSSLAFRTLSALGAKNLIRLCVPEIVVRECTSQTAERVSEFEQIARRNVAALRKLSPGDIQAKFDTLEQLLSAHAAELKGAFRDRIHTWIKEARVIVIPIRGHHGNQVIAAYFDGSAPFKKAKNRDDFPDAFIWQALVDLATNETRDIQFISNDAALQQYATETGLRVTVHKDILPLLTSGSLPIKTGEADYNLALQFKKAARDVEASVRSVIHTALPDFDLPMPLGIASDANAGPFRVERVLALRNLILDTDSITPLGDRTFSLRFVASVNFRAIYRSERDRQVGTFDILKTERLRGDYLGDVSGNILLKASTSAANWPGNAQVELEEVQILSCKPAHFVPATSLTGDVRIRANMETLGHAIRVCRGLVLIVGRSRTRKTCAASVLLNDVGTTHPDSLFLATHGRLAETPTGSVRPLPRKSFENDDAFLDKIEGLQPDGLAMQIDDSNDLKLAQYFTVVSDMFVIGIAAAKTEEELKNLTDHVWVEAITVTAT